MASWPLFAWVKGNNYGTGRSGTYANGIEAHLYGSDTPLGRRPKVKVVVRFEHGKEMVRITFQNVDSQYGRTVYHDQVIYDGPLDIFPKADILQP